MRRTAMAGAILLISSACGSEDGPAVTGAEATAPVAQPTAAQPTAAPTAAVAATTPGFISVKVDGVAKRFDYMAAEDNTAIPTATRITARAGANEEHGVRLMLVGTDVRQETLPKTFEMVPPTHANLRMRMVALEYYDEQGTRYVSANARVECTSLEQRVLRCSFGDTTLRVPRSRTEVQLSEGVVEVTLSYDEALDQAAGVLQTATGTN